MTVRRFLSLVLLVPGLSLHAADSTEAAQQWLRGQVDQVLKAADGAPTRAVLVERLRPILLKDIAFEVMTRRSVGPGWRQFTPDQQVKAQALFSTLVIRSYSNKFTLGEHPEILIHKAESPAQGRVDVSTTTVYQGSRYSVIYRLEQESGWHVTDVVIEGVSMVANYRGQLDAAFKRGGATTVISSLNDSVSRPQ